MITSSLNNGLRLRDIEHETGPIFVINNSSDPESRIVCGIQRMNGQGVDTLRLALTWLPIDVTEQIPRQQLMASSDFRKLIDSGLGLLVRTEYAMQLLQTPEAEAERENLKNENDRLEAAMRNQHLAEGQETADPSEEQKSERRKMLQQVMSNHSAVVVPASTGRRGLAALEDSSSKKEKSSLTIRVEAIIEDSKKGTSVADVVQLIKALPEEKLKKVHFTALVEAFEHTATIMSILRPMWKKYKARMKAK